MKVKIKRFDKSLPLPNYEKGAAGFDFYCREKVEIKPREIKLVRANNAVQVPGGNVLFIFARSSTPLRKGLILANGVGVVDPFYCGDNDEIMLEFFNITDHTVMVEKGEQIAQGVIVKFEQAEWLEVDKFDLPGRGGYELEK